LGKEGVSFANLRQLQEMKLDLTVLICRCEPRDRKNKHTSLDSYETAPEADSLPAQVLTAISYRAAITAS